MLRSLIALTAAGATSMCAVDSGRLAAQVRSERCDLVATGLSTVIERFDTGAEMTDVLREEVSLQAEMFIAALSSGDVSGGVWTASPRRADESNAIRHRLRDNLVSIDRCMTPVERELGVRLVGVEARPTRPREPRMYAVLGPLIVDRASNRAYMSVLTRGNRRGACWDALEFAPDSYGRLQPRFVANAPGSCFRIEPASIRRVASAD